MFCGKINTSFCSIELAHSIYPTSQICVIESYIVHQFCFIQFVFANRMILYQFSCQNEQLFNTKSVNKFNGNIF